MKIGILSDTHGSISVTSQVAQAMLKAGAKMVFHCGDIGGREVLAELSNLLGSKGIPVHAVLGNVDTHAHDLRFLPSGPGIHMHGRFGEVTCGNVRIALMHGDDPRRFNDAVFSAAYDLLLTGHTHAVHDYMEGRTRCINPGSAGRGLPNSCAVLDLESGAFDVIEL